MVEEFENRRSPTEVLNGTAGTGVAALVATVRGTTDGAMPVAVPESGLKVTWTVQDCPGAMGEVQVLVCEKCMVSERVMPLIVRGSWPVEETVKVEFTVLPMRTG